MPDYSMRLEDIRAVEPTWYAPWASRLVNDPRDVVFIGLMGQCAALSAVGIGLFFAGELSWWVGPVYWLVLALGLLDRFTLMLHCTSHRPLFRPEHRWANEIIPWALAPFFGQTPKTYFAHHMGMHHREENLEADLSSTMRFQRDRLSHWLQYYGRFLFLCVFDLSRYFGERGRDRLKRDVIVGEGGYALVMVGLLFVNPAATLVVFLVPLLLIRTLMMIGNWGQHAFIAQAHPEDPHLSSITCVNSRYNRRCFNDGYHIGHHVSARTHWTEYPVELEENVAEYVKKDAIVFEGIDFFIVWLLLMTGSWKRLARAYVRLPGAPERTEDEIIALLKERVRPIPAREAAATVAAHAA